MSAAENFENFLQQVPGLLLRSHWDFQPNLLVSQIAFRNKHLADNPWSM